MNIENLVLIVFAITLTEILVGGAIVHVLIPFNMGSFIGKTILSGILSLVLGIIFGSIVNIFTDPQLAILLGIIAGQITGYTLWIIRILQWMWKMFTKFFKWIWNISTWWIKFLIGIATIILVSCFIIKYII